MYIRRIYQWAKRLSQINITHILFFTTFPFYPRLEGSYIIHASQDIVSTPHNCNRERYNGGVSHVLSAEIQQNLSNEEENLLVQWIMDLEQAGHAPSFASVKATTSVIPCENSTAALPGKNWMTRFIKRHSSIKSKIGMKLERQRANSVTEEGILEWFHRLKTVIDKHSIKSDDMWNADGHDFASGIGSSSS